MLNFVCLFLIYMLITFNTNFDAFDKIYEIKNKSFSLFINFVNYNVVFELISCALVVFRNSDALKISSLTPLRFTSICTKNR